MARKGTKLIEKNPKAIKQTIAAVEGATAINAGITQQDANKPHVSGRMSIGELATLHYTGTEEMPPRPFLGQWFDANQPKLMRDLHNMAALILQKPRSRKALVTALAKEWEASLHDFVLGGKVTPPLRPSTIEKKGHDIPLVETLDFLEYMKVSYKLFMGAAGNVVSLLKPK